MANFRHAGAVSLLILTLAVPAWGCRRDEEPTKVPRRARRQPAAAELRPISEAFGWWSLVEEDVPPTDLIAVAPDQRPVVNRRFYRLKPDRRVLHAIAEVSHLVSGDDVGLMAIGLRDESWEICWNGEVVGTLAELPSLDEDLALVRSWVQRVKPREGWRRGAAVRPLQLASLADRLHSARPVVVLTALKELDAIWMASPGDAKVASMALSALSWLSQLTSDELDLADRLAGRRLALLAILQQSKSDDFARAEAWIASEMRYETHARKVAHRLPTVDPVRLYLTGGKEALERAPEPADPFDAYLRLRARAARDRGKRWEQELASSRWGRDPGLLPYLLEAPALGIREEYGHALSLLAEIEAEVLGCGSPTASARSGSADERLSALSVCVGELPQSRLADFQAGVEELAATMKGGALVDGYLAREVLRAGADSALLQVAGFFLDRFGDVDGAESFGKSLPTSGDETVTELRDWVLHRVDARRGRPGAGARLAADIAGMKHLGIYPLARIRYSATYAIGTADGPVLRRAMRPFFDRLDSRPEGLEEGTACASAVLKDFALRDHLARRARAEAPAATLQMVAAAVRLSEDWETLLARATDREEALPVRQDAVTSLMENGATAHSLAAGRALLREHPESVAVVKLVAELLEKSGDVRGADLVLKSWVEKAPVHDLAWAEVLVAQAGVQERAGRVEDAWRVIEPALVTGKQDVLETGARILSRLERLEEALELARSNTGRYGDGQLATAEILWKMGRLEEAADVIGAARAVTASQWEWDAPGRFAGAFDAKSGAPRIDDARRAFNALVARKIAPDRLLAFASGLTRDGHAALADAILPGLRVSDPGWHRYYSAVAAAKVRGPLAARAILEACPPENINTVAIVSYEFGEFELLWQLPKNPDPEKEDVVHFLRSAALVHLRERQGTRHDGEVAYFRGRSGKSFAGLGMFLLGEAPISVVYQRTGGAQDLASSAYTLGLAAAGNGRYEEANAWLQVALEWWEDGPPGAFALTLLGRWEKTKRPLSVIEREGVL